jgi:hypothetical protein
MTNIETLVRRIDMRYPIFFDSSAFQCSVDKRTGESLLRDLEAKDYEEGIEKLLAVSPERIRHHIETIEDIGWAISNNNPAFIPEVIKEVSTYRNNVAGYNTFCKGVCRNARFERTRQDTKDLKEKSMLIQWLVDELNEICPQMYGHNPHVCFEDEEKKMYEKMLGWTLPEMERRDKIKALRYGERPESLGKRLKTDAKLLAAALTLSCTTPTYLLTRDRPLLRAAKLLKRKVKNPGTEAILPMLHKSTLYVINVSTTTQVPILGPLLGNRA